MHHEFVCIIIHPPFDVRDIWGGRQGNSYFAKIWRKDYIKQNSRELEYVQGNVESGGSSIPDLNPALAFLTNFASTKFSSHNPKIPNAITSMMFSIYRNIPFFLNYILILHFFDTTMTRWFKYTLSQSKVHFNASQTLYNKVFCQEQNNFLAFLFSPHNR